MHEGGLATDLLEAVLAAAAAHAPARVTLVDLDAGEGAVPSEEALAWHFAHVAAGTPAQGARLRVTRLADEPWSCRLTGLEVEELPDRSGDVEGAAPQASRA
jgi:Zn finger protein HypA/HybF involved in hydrogenase expression